MWSSSKYLWGLFLAPIICSLYFAVLFALIRSGELLEVSEGSNPFLELAEQISVMDVPELDEAIALYDKQRALLVSDFDTRKRYLKNSRKYWLQASNARPNWPYYQIEAWSAEINLGYPVEDLQSRFDLIIAIAPNERGIDKPLTETGLAIWFQLRKDQRQLIIDRMLSSGMPSSIDFILQKAEERGIKAFVCIRMPWAIAKKHCL